MRVKLCVNNSTDTAMETVITPLTHKDDDWRGVLMRGLVDFHYRYYHRLTYRDKQPWAITTDQLQDLPENSVGYHLG